MVGDEKSINIWLDLWVPWIEGFKPKPKDDYVPQLSIMVDSLIMLNTKEWNQDLLNQLFDRNSIEAIKRIPIPFDN